jgi:hypothetical protein
VEVRPCSGEIQMRWKFRTIVYGISQQSLRLPMIFKLGGLSGFTATLKPQRGKSLGSSFITSPLFSPLFGFVWVISMKSLTKMKNMGQQSGLGVKWRLFRERWMSADCVIWVLKARNSLGIMEGMGRPSQRNDWIGELPTKEWCAIHADVELSVLASRSSDHNPLLVTFRKHDETSWRKCRQFRYEASWSKNRDFKSTFKQIWQAKPAVQDKWANILGKLRHSQYSIKKWVRKTELKTEELIQQKTRELADLQLRTNGDNLTEEITTKNELQLLLEEEDLKWRQRSKQNWLKCGDRKTNFFHSCANQRSSRNLISNIKDGNGHQCVNQQEIEAAFISFFTDLFTSNTPRDIDQCTQDMGRLVTESMNDRLMAEFTREEFHQALFQMAPKSSRAGWIFSRFLSAKLGDYPRGGK